VRAGSAAPRHSIGSRAVRLAAVRLALVRLFLAVVHAAGLLFALGNCAAAAEGDWDGSTYLRVPVRLGSDTRLVMPEAFDDAWERDSEVACTLLDARTLIIRPRSSSIEQRLTLRGRKTGTLYLARVSSALPYVPIVTVRNLAALRDEAPSGRPQPTVVGLLKAMMQGVAPAGYQVQTSQRVLFDEAPYRIVAQQVWRSRRQTGIVAQLSSSLPGRTIPVVPANIFIRIPELGLLRAMAADEFELDASHVSTRIYLVYAN
jgi:hypothetical protein